MTRHPAASGARRVLARHRRAGGEQGEVALREVEALELAAPGSARPRKLTLRPRERSLASANSFATGKSRSSSTLTIVSPTRPVAPTTATVNCLSMRDCFLAHARSGDPARDQPRGA